MLESEGMWDPRAAFNCQPLPWHQKLNSEAWDSFLKLWIECLQGDIQHLW